MDRQDSRDETEVSSTRSSNENTEARKRRAHHRPKRPCKYCGEFQSQFKRHLIRKHKNEEEVKAALALPKDEILQAIGQIRKDGIYKENINRMNKNGDITVLRERKQGHCDVVMCGNCRGFYSNKTLWRHKQVCHSDTTSKILSLPVSSLKKCPGSDVDEDFQWHVLNRFRSDRVGELCRSDSVIIRVGKTFWSKSVQREKAVVMCNMRRLGLLVVKLRLVCNNESLTGEDLLKRKNFSALESAIDLVTEKEGNDIKAGLRLGIGYLLKRVCKIMKAVYIIDERINDAEEIDMFLTVLDLKWDYLFRRSQYLVEGRHQAVLRKPHGMPLEEDIRKIKEFTVDSMKKIVDGQYQFRDCHVFHQLRSLIVSRLTLFNARRGGEPARLTLKEWTDAENGASVDPQRIEAIDDPMERSLLKSFRLAYQSGKGSLKLVPILIPSDTVDAIKLLVDMRSDAGVAESNPYLFPLTQKSRGHVDGWQANKEVASDIKDQLKIADLLTATKYRHGASILYALQDVPEQERQAFNLHMGIYRCPLAIREMTSVGKYVHVNTIDGPTKLQSTSRRNHSSPQMSSKYNSTTSGPRNSYMRPRRRRTNYFVKKGKMFWSSLKRNGDEPLQRNKLSLVAALLDTAENHSDIQHSSGQINGEATSDIFKEAQHDTDSCVVNLHRLNTEEPVLILFTKQRNLFAYKQRGTCSYIVRDSAVRGNKKNSSSMSTKYNGNLRSKTGTSSRYQEERRTVQQIAKKSTSQPVKDFQPTRSNYPNLNQDSSRIPEKRQRLSDTCTSNCQRDHFQYENDRHLPPVNHREGSQSRERVYWQDDLASCADEYHLSRPQGSKRHEFPSFRGSRENSERHCDKRGPGFRSYQQNNTEKSYKRNAFQKGSYDRHWNQGSLNNARIDKHPDRTNARSGSSSRDPSPAEVDTKTLHQGPSNRRRRDELRKELSEPACKEPGGNGGLEAKEGVSTSNIKDKGPVVQSERRRNVDTIVATTSKLALKHTAENQTSTSKKKGHSSTNYGKKRTVSQQKKEEDGACGTENQDYFAADSASKSTHEEIQQLSPVVNAESGQLGGESSLNTGDLPSASDCNHPKGTRSTDPSQDEAKHLNPLHNRVTSHESTACPFHINQSCLPEENPQSLIPMNDTSEEARTIPLSGPSEVDKVDEPMDVSFDCAKSAETCLQDVAPPPCSSSNQKPNPVTELKLDSEVSLSEVAELSKPENGNGCPSSASDKLPTNVSLLENHSSSPSSEKAEMEVATSFDRTKETVLSISTSLPSITKSSEECVESEPTSRQESVKEPELSQPVETELRDLKADKRRRPSSEEMEPLEKTTSENYSKKTKLINSDSETKSVVVEAVVDDDACSSKATAKKTTSASPSPSSVPTSSHGTVQSGQCDKLKQISKKDLRLLIEKNAQTALQSKLKLLQRQLEVSSIAEQAWKERTMELQEQLQVMQREFTEVKGQNDKLAAEATGLQEQMDTLKKPGNKVKKKKIQEEMSKNISLQQPHQQNYERLMALAPAANLNANPTSATKTGLHPAPLPALPTPNSKAPLKPELNITKVENGIDLSWNMNLDPTGMLPQVDVYHLYAYKESESPPSTSLWKKIGEVRALPLPMACILTMFQPGGVYHFAVCAVDDQGQAGPFSNPSSIHLPRT